MSNSQELELLCELDGIGTYSVSKEDEYDAIWRLHHRGFTRYAPKWVGYTIPDHEKSFLVGRGLTPEGYKRKEELEHRIRTFLERYWLQLLGTSVGIAGLILAILKYGF